jgi:hypothetical protein|tara:strand:- start:4052 stop:4390 length:339 start_codon:yes stop_codon:yes gene_type:complete
MSGFFDSDIVQDEMETINEMQEEIYGKVFDFPTLPLEEQVEHLEMLDDLLDKQQVLYTRMKLSDDPRAKEIADNVRQSAIVMGFPKNIDCNVLFANMRETLDKVRKGIDKAL